MEAVIVEPADSMCPQPPHAGGSVGVPTCAKRQIYSADEMAKHRHALLQRLACREAPPAPDALCHRCCERPAVVECSDCQAALGGGGRLLCSRCDELQHPYAHVHSRASWQQGYRQPLETNQAFTAEGELVTTGAQQPQLQVNGDAHTTLCRPLHVRACFCAEKHFPVTPFGCSTSGCSGEWRQEPCSFTPLIYISTGASVPQSPSGWRSVARRAASYTGAMRYRRAAHLLQGRIPVPPLRQSHAAGPCGAAARGGLGGHC